MMFKLNILGENDKVVKTYESSCIRYGLIEDLVVLSEQMEGKTIFQQFAMMKPLFKTMFVGVTDEELRNVNLQEVMGVFKQLMAIAKDGYGTNEEKN